MHTTLFRRAIVATAAVALFSSPLLAQSEKIDLAAMQKIRDEGFNHSQVMDIASWLTDVYGPRLTGSPNIKKAGDWTVAQMKSWGIANPRLEPWGPFGRGWESERFSAQVLEPTKYPIIAYPNAWSESTNGPRVGNVVYAQIDSEADFAKYRGKLRGAWIMRAAAPELQPHFKADASRQSDSVLVAMANRQVEVQQAGRGGRGGGRGGADFAARQALQTKINQFFIDEGALGFLATGNRNDDGTVFVSGTGYQPTTPKTLPTFTLAAEHYGRMFRTIQKGLPVKLEIESKTRYYADDLNSFNVVGEIPGTDARLKDDIVMLGAHFDSWHGGTGATDNAAGSAVMLEALRILKKLNLPMKRTVRIGLWTGEEEGLLGSRAYVRQHFGYRDSTGEHFTPENAKVAGYFNVDNGTGAIRGVYLQENSIVGPIFKQWLEPFKDLGASTVTISNTGGTDHQSFDAVGIPGFQFIQDGIDYNTRTHHSNMDLYERLQPKDMMQNAVIVAAFVYDAANRDGALPRKK
jgi:carboxypeptidase Q